MNDIARSLTRIAERTGVPFAVLREEWEERAAIREHMAGMRRDPAELAAVDDVASMHPDVIAP